MPLAINDKVHMNSMFFLDNFNHKLQQVRDAGEITKEEYNAANLPMWFRTKDDIIRAFDHPNQEVAQELSQLKVLSVDVSEMPDPYFEKFKQGKVSKEQFAKEYVSSCQAWSKSSLAGAFKDSKVLDQVYDYVVEEIIKSNENEFTGDNYVEANVIIEKK